MSTNLEKLAKVLSELSGYKRQGLISRDILEKQIFNDQKTAFQYLWMYYTDKETNADSISEDAFIRGSENIFGVITDKDQVQFYLKMFSKDSELLGKSSFMDFLQSAYIMYRTIHNLCNQEDVSSPGTMTWMETVYKSAFHIKQEMSIFFLTNWILTNTPRLLLPMHKYITHQLTTSYGRIKSGQSNITKSSNSPTKQQTNEPEDKDSEKDPITNLIHPLLMWLLRSSLPGKFLSVLDRRPEIEIAKSSSNGAMSAQQLMQNLMDAVVIFMHSQLANLPATETWSLLYDSDDQGLSINRFQHHVFNYRGPTLMFVKADNDYLFCIAADIEWRESCHFWGGEESMLLMVKPEFRVVEKGAKLLYANFSIRGYPFGIQVGKDPRNLSIEIKPEFNYVSYKQIPCKLMRFIAWGCAPPQVKVSQADLRKWEEKQAEKNRKIDLNNPEWKDNPDKYLLELAGSYRSYNNQ